MSGFVWLASYPKSGNTWMRILFNGLWRDAGETVDINEISDSGGIASNRAMFDQTLLIESGLLTYDEIDLLRPRLYEELARRGRRGWDEEDGGHSSAPERFVKVHDAYTNTSTGEPLLGGARGARGAIVIVRDPRDVVPSVANHMHFSIDRAVRFVNDPTTTMSIGAGFQQQQLRQTLLDWSGHVASWLDQADIPVHLVRYEDLKRDTAGTLAAALRFVALEASEEMIARAVAQASFANLQAQELQKGFAEWTRAKRGPELFFRRGETGAWRAELSAEQVGAIERCHGAMMTRLGYELSSPA